MNIDQALLNPSREFSCPNDVFVEPSLSRDQKILQTFGPTHRMSMGL